MNFYYIVLLSLTGVSLGVLVGWLMSKFRRWLASHMNWFAPWM